MPAQLRLNEGRERKAGTAAALLGGKDTVAGCYGRAKAVLLTTFVLVSPSTSFKLHPAPLRRPIVSASSLMSDRGLSLIAFLNSACYACSMDQMALLITTQLLQQVVEAMSMTLVGTSTYHPYARCQCRAGPFGV